MSPVDKAILVAIRRLQAPSLRELAQHVGLAFSSIRQRLLRLDLSGYVIWDYYCQRTLRVSPHVATWTVDGEPCVGVVAW